MTHHFEGVRTVVELNSHVGGVCEECQKLILTAAGENMGQAVTHYITAHGYKLLHIGTQTDGDDAGLLYRTVAFVGK